MLNETTMSEVTVNISIWIGTHLVEDVVITFGCKDEDQMTLSAYRDE